MGERVVRVGLLKSVPEVWNLEKNMSDFERHAEEAHRQGVQLLVTCETYLDGYVPLAKDFCFDKLVSVSQDIGKSEYLERARAVARRTGMVVVFCFSLREGAAISNAALLVDRNGRDIGVYRKTHLHDQDTVYTPGDDLPVFDTELGKIGLMICADRRWPEVPRTLKLKGAELIANPSLGMCNYDNEWWMRTKSYENEIYIAFCHARVGFVCNPRGELEAKLSSNVPGVLVHDIDLSVKVNAMLPIRRPDLYGIIGQTKA